MAEIRLTYDEQTLVFDSEAPYQEQLTNADVIYRWPFVMIANGAMDNDPPCELVSAPLNLEFGETVWSEEQFDLESGQAHVFDLREPEELTLRVDPADSAFWPKYRAGGPPIQEAPLAELLMLAEQTRFFGPWPDSADTDASGSYRLRACRDPDAMLMLTLHDRGVLPQSVVRRFHEHALEWVNYQLKRGMHFYYRHQGYRQWQADRDPGIPYQGYGMSVGGFRDGLFGEPAPKGFDWPNSGLGVPDPQHLAHDQCIVISLLCECWPAMFNVIAGLEAVQKVLLREKMGHGRGYAHALRNINMAGAAYAPYAPETSERLFNYSHEVKQVLHKRRHTVNCKSTGTITLPLVDFGTSTDGGHLTVTEMQPVFDFLGIEDPELKRAGAQSFNTWMEVGIMLIGIDMRVRFNPTPLSPAELDIIRNVWDGMLAATGKAFVPSRFRFEMPDVCWDNIAIWGHSGLPVMPVPFAEDGGPNFEKGVAIRFLGPALALAAKHPNLFPGARQILHRLVKSCNGWYNGPKPIRWVLEGWVQGYIYGWNPLNVL